MTKSAASPVKTARKGPVASSVPAAPKAATKPSTSTTATRKAAVKGAALPAVKASRSTSPSTRAAPAARSAAAEPSLRFHYPEPLRARTHAVLAALEAAPERPGHGDAVAGVVSELVEAGMDYYFMRALRRAEVGFVAEQTARVGMSGALKLVNSMSRKFIVRMDNRQLLIVAQHIRELN